MLKNLVIWMIAIVLSVLSGTLALGAVAKNKTPVLALSLFPTNGFAAETRSSGMTKALVAESLGKFPDRLDGSWSGLALQAFEAEPVVPDAVAVMALSQKGSVRSELMRKAFALSRRQKLVTGWLIAESVDRNDMEGVLRYYDSSLRVDDAVAAVIIPAMANALVDEKFIEPLANFLSTKPPWAENFWAQVEVEPSVQQNAAILRSRLYVPGETGPPYRDKGLIRALAKQGNFEDAERLYRQLSGISDNDLMFQDLAFKSESKYPPLDWRLISTGEYGAAIVREQLKLSAIANSGGLFARRLVKLPKGDLEINVQLVQNVPTSANLNLNLSCAEEIADKPRNVKIPLKTKLLKRTISNRKFLCKYYWLDIVGRATEDYDGFDVDIDKISLRQIGGNQR